MRRSRLSLRLVSYGLRGADQRAVPCAGRSFDRIARSTPANTRLFLCPRYRATRCRPVATVLPATRYRRDAPTSRCQLPAPTSHMDLPQAIGPQLGTSAARLVSLPLPINPAKADDLTSGSLPTSTGGMPAAPGTQARAI